jgi:cation diffusion facilitator family transporter
LIQQIDTDEIASAVRRLYYRAGLVAVVGNVLLLAGKALVALQSGSSAIYADAANSASDVVYALLMVGGLWFSLRPPDRNHPHGHRRVEPFVSMLIGLAMTAAGVEALRGAYRTWRAGAVAVTSTWALAMPVFTAAIKVGMYRSVVAMGRSAKSPALAAAAKDNLADVVSSAMALVGVVVSRVGFPLADPIAALMLAAWILRAAWDVLYEGWCLLTGCAPATELTEAVITAVLGVPDVLGADRVIIDHVGPQVRADIHIKMSGSSSLNQAHWVSHQVREAVEALEDVDHAFIHVEPIEPIAERETG